jgi:hypothetical protein
METSFQSGVDLLRKLREKPPEYIYMDTTQLGPYSLSAVVDY